RLHADKDRRKSRNTGARQTLIDVVEIIEPEADNLARLCYREAIFQSGERTAGGGRRSAGEIGKGFETAVAPAQGFAEIAGRGGVRRLQIDDGVALDHAKPQAVIRFKTDNLHRVPALTFCCGERLSAGISLCHSGTARSAGPGIQEQRPHVWHWIPGSLAIARAPEIR